MFSSTKYTVKNDTLNIRTSVVENNIVKNNQYIISNPRY